MDQRVKGLHANDGVRPFQQQARNAIGGLQARAPWNLNRVSHPSLPIMSSYKYASDGSNVNVYVLDTVRCVCSVRRHAVAYLSAAPWPAPRPAPRPW